MASNIQITQTRSSFQAAFALDVVTAGAALTLLGLASRPTFQRIKERRFSIATDDRPLPLKTTLGTYLFLWPALLCILVAYTCRFAQDLLQSDGTIGYDQNLQLHGRYPSDNEHGSSTSALSFTTALASVLFTTLLNGGVWIYSAHTLSNGTGREAPTFKDKIYNTLIMLCILGTGLAAWGHGMSIRGQQTSWASVIDQDNVTRILYVVHQCVVVAASISVSVQVAREYLECNANSSKESPERPYLAVFAMVVVPLIWLRNAFIVYDIVLLYLETSDWSTPATLASQFLLIVFGQLANVTILGMILWGAWRTGRTVPIFGKMPR